MTDIGADTRFRVREDVHFREFDGEVVLLDLRTGDYFGINEVGAHTWRALSRGRSVAEVADEIVAEYDVARERALDDALALVRDLLARDLVVVEAAP